MKTPFVPTPSGSSHREFRDVVFEDVGFESNSLSTLNDRRCGDFTPKADMGEGFNHVSLNSYYSELLLTTITHPETPIPEHAISSRSHRREGMLNTLVKERGVSDRQRKMEVLPRAVGTRRDFFPPSASLRWQPDGLTIHTNKWFLGAGFLGAPPVSLRLEDP